MSPEAEGWAILGRAIGRPVELLVASLGEPAARRRVGESLWLVFDAPDGILRVRGRVGSRGATVASWSLTFRNGPVTLRAATEPLGLWPACGPEAAEGGDDEPLLLRAVPGGGDGGLCSFTASIRGGRIRTVALFDEPPEWL
ncbi:MAG: hypothetical protein JSV95_10070 [Gemmatimonadota bacterium]|nr:MAG: hypothetical protein JSV95_10070 [Gemmatimonadota bacterium]